MTLTPEQRPEGGLSQSNPGQNIPVSDDSVRRLLIEDLAVWVLIVFLLQGFRLTLLCLFRGEMSPESNVAQVLRCLGTGLRFDISIASYGVIPMLVFTLVSFFQPMGHWLSRVRLGWCLLLTGLSLLTFVIDVAYFREYHDQFNHWIFGVWFDDRGAIAKTIWKSYPIVWLFLAVAGLTLLLFFAGLTVWRALFRRIVLPRLFFVGWKRWIAALLILAFLFMGLRASLGRRPIQMKDAAVTLDPFLNKLVMNPYAALKYAIKQHQMLSQSKGLQMILPGGDVRGAARACFPQAYTWTNLDQCLQRSAMGASIARPQHIVLVVMESYDAWGLRPEMAPLHATERLAKLSKSGIAADAFLPAGDGTMPSLAALITGLPDTGVHLNYQPSVRAGVPTDTAPIFQRLGYRTRFFYSGYLSWQRLGEFCREQGFDEVHGGAEMSERLTGNEWGVDDEELYAFVLKQLGDQPSFNIIMTTSYHPPFSVDLDAKGFPRRTLEPEMSARGFTEENKRILGHLWYSDKAVGDFVAAAEKQHNNRVLFAVTGDHWGRRTYTAHTILFGRRAVTFVLYGSEMLANVRRPDRMAGSHIDIVPTLVELVAEKGFTYHSFGRNMLDLSLPQIGFGCSSVVTPETIIDINPPVQVEDMQGKSNTNCPSVDDWVLHYQQLHALSWWRAMRGNTL